MADFSFNAVDLVWSFTIALAWIVGEFAYRLIKLPRISTYGVVGFLMGCLQSELLSHVDNSKMLLLANIAFGLILFEFGYRINLRWLKNNPWIGVISVVEASATFIAVYAFSQWFGMSMLTSLLLSALAMAASPAGILRVINEQRSSGQVTERILHLSAFSCFLSVTAFNVVIVLWKSEITKNILQDAINSAVFIGSSVALGAIFGWILPAILRRLSNLVQDSTIAFALAVIVLVTLADAAKLSPILAAAVFGLTVGHRRVTLSRTKRNFGVLGDLLTIILFVFVASTLEWSRVVDGATLGLAIVGIRIGVKMLASATFAHWSGITFKKGLLTGIGLAPISVFALLTLAQTRYFHTTLMDDLSALAAMILILDIVGPILTQCALIFAGETSLEKE